MIKIKGYAIMNSTGQAVCVDGDLKYHWVRLENERFSIFNTTKSALKFIKANHMKGDVFAIKVEVTV